MPTNSHTPATEGAAAEIRAAVAKVIYQRTDTGYAVLSCRVEEAAADNVVVTGTFPGIRPEMTVIAAGKWVRHPKYGFQFQCETWKEAVPSSAGAIRKYLASGQVAGIGPVLAERLVDTFGEETFDVIENHPERLGEVRGVGKKKIESICARLKEQHAVRDIMVFLKDHDVSNAFAAKIYGHYGDESIEILRTNPYRLAYDLFGVGFRTADRLAMSVGVDPQSPDRIKCGILYLMEEALAMGDMYLTRESVLKKAEVLFEGSVPPAELIGSALSALCSEKRVVMPDAGEGEDAVYLAHCLRAERRAAERLVALAANHETPPRLLFSEEEFGEYAPQQKLAIRMATSAGVSIVTGGPGTGKTTTVRGIVRAHAALGNRVLLASPTGKAAKRLEEATGRKASTIHRLLEWSPQEHDFRRNEENPLEGDVLIVDETSMLDTPMLDKLLRAVPPHMHVVFVGDADQLPSVGPGNAFREMIDSGAVATVRLGTVFRQALGSDIVRGAHAVNAGRLPDTKARRDLRFRFCDTPARAADLIVSTLESHLARGGTLDDVQVLSPMKRGEAGCEELNRRIQEIANPHGRPVVRGQRELRVGDRVINLHNDYDKGVFNGDQGVIVGDDEENATFDIDFDGRTVTFDKCDADELIHAWAITVHRSQGSEFHSVIIAATDQHKHMLQRQLLYTAITRAKQFCLVVGSEGAVYKAVRDNSSRHRNTRLGQFIAEAQSAAAGVPDDEEDAFGGLFD